MKKVVTRCSWAELSQEMITYHDTEWGRPLFDDKKIFQAFLLDTFQPGLSWAIILSKQKNFQKAFADFNIAKVSQFTKKDAKRLLNDSGIIRNRLKIDAIISNSKKILEVQKEFGSFAKYLWQFTKGKTIQNIYKRIEDIPTTTKEAEALSKDLRKRGFRFTGPTTIYAFMQGIGMVNDHLVTCFCYQELKKPISRAS